ncbi:unnamed protein product [Jaminaea pallidilutea]
MSSRSGEFGFSLSQCQSTSQSVSQPVSQSLLPGPWMALRCSLGALRPESEGVAGLRGDYFELGRGSSDGTAASESSQSRDGSRGVGGWQEAGSERTSRTGGQSEAEGQRQAGEGDKAGGGLYARPDFRKSHSLKLDSIPTFIFSTSHTYTPHIPAMAPTKKEGRKQRSALSDVVTREYTIHLHKRTHDIAFKKRAPKGVKEVIKFAQKAMGTKDVRVDPKLNQEIWKLGVKQVPRRIRVRLERKRNDDESAKEKLYTYALPVLGITDFRGLQNETIADDA